MFNIVIPFGDFRMQALRLSRDVLAMANEFGDMRAPLNDAVDKVIIPSIETNFRSQGRPAWTPLADSTVEKRGSSFPILDDTGELRSAATSKRIWRIDNTKAEMDLTDPTYASFHQTGTATMPERPFAVLQEQDIDEIEEIFDRWVLEMAIKLGRWPI